MPATYDAWKRARSPNEFEDLVRGERHLYGASAIRNMCIAGLRVFKNLQYSPITWLYLIILGTLCATYGLIVDGWVQTLFKWRRVMLEATGKDGWGAFFLWIFWLCGMGMISTTCGHYVPSSDGSGIPRMRALFAGVFQNPMDILSFRTFVAKSFGTVVSSASGLSVGRAGPYSHICTIIGYLLGKLSLFRRVYFGPENYNYLRAAVACGVTASFGSPLGGVLFSIEVTAKYYEIKCLWEGVICSSFCIFVFNMITTLKGEALFERTSFDGFNMNWDLLAFVLLGVITGIGSGLFCHGALILRNIQDMMFQYFKSTQPSYRRRTIHILSICSFTAIITFPLYVMRLSDRAFVNEVFHDRPINHTAFFQISEWPQMSLFVYIILKFLTSILPCGSPMSIGVFGPLFTIGAAVGRLYGETLVHLWSPSQSPATYAVVGAAAFASAATQTVSTSVIFFELTGQLSHMLPVMLACITAYFVSGIIAPSIYDILAEWAGLHSVCYDINEYVLNQKTAETSMVQPSILFTRETTYNDALKALNENKNEEYFPIVDDLDNRSLIGCIRRYDLEVGIARFFTVHAPELPGGANLTVRIKKIIQETLLLDTSKVSVIDDVSLISVQHSKDEETTASPLQLGPPFNPFVYTSIPVESFPPQVGEDVNLNRVHKIAAMYLWTQVYVVKQGKLLGVINLESSLTKYRKEEAPVLLSP